MASKGKKKGKKAVAMETRKPPKDPEEPNSPPNDQPEPDNAEEKPPCVLSV